MSIVAISQNLDTALTVLVWLMVAFATFPLVVAVVSLLITVWRILFVESDPQ